ncbi:hypothetical protein DL96DRAFT_1720685 [Flagelloscypha sp. PMI_526]|nr:hypothetical protein DL96DRAFT_1720685 [Flagelloscypha sp. PMI_526]
MQVLPYCQSCFQNLTHPLPNWTSPPIASSSVSLAASTLGVFRPTNQMRACPPLSPSSLQTTLDALQTQLQVATSSSAPSQQSPPNLHPPPHPPLPALASSVAAESGPLHVTKLPFPPPVPSVSSSRLPKRMPLALPLSAPPTSSM